MEILITLKNIIIKKWVLILVFITLLIIFIFESDIFTNYRYYIKQNINYDSEIAIKKEASVTEEIPCTNSQEVKIFTVAIPVVWEAILDVCLSGCGGGSFTKLNSSKNEKHPRFVGYLKDGKTIPENLLAKGIKLKISGKWISVEDDHSRTVFNNKCVPIVEIEKIEIENK